MMDAVFKSYDIRGLSPGQIDEAFARRLGKVLARLERPRRVLVGHDMRTTSDVLNAALIQGFLSSGVDVVDIGLCSTPIFNVAVGEGGDAIDVGVMVTASHNPSEYNGFKLVKRHCVPIGQGSGMEQIRDLHQSDEPLLDVVDRGETTSDDGAVVRYLERIFSFAQLPAKLPAWRIAVDAGNGMDGLALPKIGKRLTGIDLTQLYWDMDGRFPNHEANPLKVETLAKLRQSVIRDGCVFGVAFDGDGDRVGFVDESGEPIPGDILTALFAQEILRLRGPGLVLYDLRSSWSVPEAIQAAGGQAAICRVGHAHIKRQMREQSAVFAGELSMHFYFSELWNVESGDLAMLLMLKLLIREGQPLSRLWRPLRRYAHSGEINFLVKDQTAAIDRIRQRYAAQATDASDLDGLRYEFRFPEHPADDWWFSLRASNTEPLLRLNLEARTPALMEQHKAELSAMLAA